MLCEEVTDLRNMISREMIGQLQQPSMETIDSMETKADSESSLPSDSQLLLDHSHSFDINAARFFHNDENRKMVLFQNNVKSYVQRKTQSELDASLPAIFPPPKDKF